MTELSVSVVKRTVAQILSRGLEIAQANQLPVTSWADVSPTRILFDVLSDALSLIETLRTDFVRSAWRATANLSWKRVIATEVYGATPRVATYASPTVQVTNTGTRYYAPEPGGLVFGSSATNRTYHNTSDHQEPTDAIAPGTTRIISLVADEPGSASAVAANEIDLLVTPMVGVVILSSTPSYASDDASGVEIDADCADKIGARSPNGPQDAPAFFARQSSVEITRASVAGNSATGAFVVYVSGPNGAVSSEARAAALASVQANATHVCGTPSVAAATLVPVTISVSVAGVGIPATFAAEAEKSLAAIVRTTIGGESITTDQIRGELYRLATDADAVTGGGATGVRITLLSPLADLDFLISEHPTLGAISVTV